MSVSQFRPRVCAKRTNRTLYQIRGVRCETHRSLRVKSQGIHHNKHAFGSNHHPLIGRAPRIGCFQGPTVDITFSACTLLRYELDAMLVIYTPLIPYVQHFALYDCDHVCYGLQYGEHNYRMLRCAKCGRVNHARQTNH